MTEETQPHRTTEMPPRECTSTVLGGDVPAQLDHTQQAAEEEPEGKKAKSR